MINYDFLYPCHKERFAAYFGQRHLVDKTLGFREVKNGYILPHRPLNGKNAGGVVTEEGIYLEETALHTKQGDAYDFSAQQVQKKSETVIYIGMFVGIWGHCLTDNIRRLWFLRSESYRRRFAGCKLVYVPFQSFTFSDSFSTLLRILGVDKEQLVPITQLIQYDCVVVPDESFFSPEGDIRYFTKEYIETIELVRRWAEEHAKPTGMDRIYFTYSHYAAQKQIGEEKLEKFFAQRGYHIIAPENVTFEEQLNLLYHCRAFAATVGSCSHNVIFLRPGTQATLIPRAQYLTGYQLALDELWPLDVRYVDANLSVFANGNAPWAGPFFYYVSDELIWAFGEEPVHDKKYWKENFKDFNQYIAVGLENYRAQGCNPPAEYLERVVAYLQQYLNTSVWSRFVRRWGMKDIFSYCIWTDRIANGK